MSRLEEQAHLNDPAFPQHYHVERHGQDYATSEELQHIRLGQQALSKETGGKKDDGDKIRMELIPPELMTAVGAILTFGARKYEDRNWEKGIAWSRVYGALMRHMWAWWGGEESDPETRKSHLWHAGCCIAFLIAFEERAIGPDDRPNS